MVLAAADLANVGVTYLLNYGVLGLVVIFGTVALLRGKLWVQPAVKALIDGHDKAMAAKNEELARANARAQKAEEQRDAAMSIAQDKIVPLAASFVEVSRTLLERLDR